MSLRERAASDAKVLLNKRDFGRAASFTPVGGSAKVIEVVFVEGWSASEAFETGAENSDAVALAKSSEVSGARPNSTLVVNNTTYYLTNPPMENGYGMSQLSLSLDAV